MASAVENLCGKTRLPALRLDKRYFQKQESAGCGRHALNNLLGGTYFMRGTENEGYIPGKYPIPLQNLCITLGRILSKGGINREVTQCPSNEYYNLSVLIAGLNLLGFNTSQSIPRNEVKTTIDTYGFLANDGGHWVSLRRTEGENYIFLDSLKSSTHGVGLMKSIAGERLTLDGFKTRNSQYTTFIRVLIPPDSRVCINPISGLTPAKSECIYNVGENIQIGDEEYTVTNRILDGNTRKCSKIYVVNVNSDHYDKILSTTLSSLFIQYFILCDEIKVYSVNSNDKLVVVDKEREIEILHTQPKSGGRTERLKMVYNRDNIIYNCIDALINKTSFPIDAYKKLGKITSDIHEMNKKGYPPKGQRWGQESDAERQSREESFEAMHKLLEEEVKLIENLFMGEDWPKDDESQGAARWHKHMFAVLTNAEADAAEGSRDPEYVAKMRERADAAKGGYNSTINDEGRAFTNDYVRRVMEQDEVVELARAQAAVRGRPRATNAAFIKGSEAANREFIKAATALAPAPAPSPASFTILNIKNVPKGFTGWSSEPRGELTLYKYWENGINKYKQWTKPKSSGAPAPATESLPVGWSVEKRRLTNGSTNQSYVYTGPDGKTSRQCKKPSSGGRRRKTQRKRKNRRTRTHTTK